MMTSPGRVPHSKKSMLAHYMCQGLMCFVVITAREALPSQLQCSGTSMALSRFATSSDAYQWHCLLTTAIPSTAQAKVSLLAHSLGSVLTWDILTAQPRLYHSLASHHDDGSLAALEALSCGSSPPGGGSPPGGVWGPRQSSAQV